MNQAKYAAVTDRISAHWEITFGPADPEALESLAALGLPDHVIEFYRHYEPSDKEGGEVRLCSIGWLCDENANFVPGCFTSKHGYIVFATTEYGDTYCFDLHTNEPQIVLITHEEYFEGFTREQIEPYAKPIATNLLDFLQQFAEESLDIEPQFPG